MVKLTKKIVIQKWINYQYNCVDCGTRHRISEKDKKGFNGLCFYCNIKKDNETKQKFIRRYNLCDMHIVDYKIDTVKTDDRGTPIAFKSLTLKDHHGNTIELYPDTNWDLKEKQWSL